MSQAPLNFDQLANRLRRLTITEDGEDLIQQVMTMDLTELREETIKFGKAHVGKTFASMAKETKYMAWFAENYKASRKPEHVKFLRFIQLHVDDLEKTNQEIRATTMPKTKAAPKPRASSRPIDLETESSGPEEWDQIQEANAQEIVQMQRCMSDMEDVMQQVLAHLKGNSSAAQ